MKLGVCDEDIDAVSDWSIDSDERIEGVNKLLSDGTEID